MAAATVQMLNTSSIVAGGEALQSKQTRDILGWVTEELKAIRRSLGAASGGSGVGSLVGSATYDPASLADGAGVTTTVTVTGAVLGDFVDMCSFSLDLQGMTLTGYVSAADTVAIRFQNESGGVLDLASGTIRAVVVPARAAALAAMVLSTPNT